VFRTVAIFGSIQHKNRVLLGNFSLVTVIEQKRLVASAPSTYFIFYKTSRNSSFLYCDTIFQNSALNDLQSTSLKLALSPC
jgi:hypothetical protein